MPEILNLGKLAPGFPKICFSKSGIEAKACSALIIAKFLVDWKSHLRLVRVDSRRWPSPTEEGRKEDLLIPGSQQG